MHSVHDKKSITSLISHYPRSIIIFWLEHCSCCCCMPQLILQPLLGCCCMVCLHSQLFSFFCGLQRTLEHFHVFLQRITQLLHVSSPPMHFIELLRHSLCCFASSGPFFHSSASSCCDSSIVTTVASSLPWLLIDCSPQSKYNTHTCASTCFWPRRC